MRAHRIPQHVIGYQGRIVGQFTLKQFVFLALGGIISFILFNTLPPGMIMVVLIVIVGGTAFLLATLDIEGRSLDAWLMSFWLALQAPLRRIWMKEEEIPEILLPTFKIPVRRLKEREPEKTKKDVGEFLEFWQGKEVGGDLTEKEREFLEKFREQIPSARLQSRVLPGVAPVPKNHA